MSKEYTPLTRGAWKKFWKAVMNADVVLEILDPRDPMAFRIPLVEKRLTELGKRVILVINKADLVPKHILEKWKKVFEREFPTVFVSARHRLGTSKLRRMIFKSAPKKSDVIRVAVIGYPNVGKSTLINILKGAHSAPTGAKPGLTRSIQAVRRGRLIILDTPGVFPYEDAETLVYKGAIRVEALDDPIYHAIELITKLKSIKPTIFREVYDVDDEDPVKLLEKLALKRLKLLKGGAPDITEAARIILRDWQVGKLVIWKEPSDYNSEEKE